MKDLTLVIFLCVFNLAVTIGIGFMTMDILSDIVGLMRQNIELDIRLIETLEKA
jgi:hypothetical protein